MNVAALTVTYNPDFELLLENIQSYSKQVSLVLVVDNSQELYSQNKINSLTEHFGNVVVIQNGANLGIAKAQNIGVKYIMESGSIDFIIEMDQDSRLVDSYVLDILYSYKRLSLVQKNIACLGPVAINSTNGEVYDGYQMNKGVFKVDKTLSSGLLIEIDSLRKIGLKEEKLFIDLVDWEWCWRAKKLGFATYIDTNLHIFHSLGERHIKFLKFRIGVPQPIRHYYAFRNSLFLLLKPYSPIKWKSTIILLLLFKIIIYPFILPNGRQRLSFMVKGLKDFMRSKYGEYQE